MFVLATKLDLNVNDMRELLDASVKETAARFEVVTTKMTDNFQSLSEQLERLRDNGVNDISQYAECHNLLRKGVWNQSKISLTPLLREENRQQNERLTILTANADTAAKNHSDLANNFQKLSLDFEKTVVEDHGSRLKTAEGKISSLENNLSKLRRDCKNDYEKCVLKMENTETEILNKMEANGKSLNTQWTKNNEETEAKINKTISIMNTKLGEHDANICKLQEKTLMNEQAIIEYKKQNGDMVAEIKEILER